METESLTEQQLIEFASQHGCEDVNHWKLERWHKKDVIPRPAVEYLGQGKGTRSIYPEQAGPQMLAVCRLLKTTRNFDVVRFQLWQEGYPISLPILKQTIRQLVPYLRWEVPHGEDQKYDEVDRQLSLFQQKMRGPFSQFLLKQFGKKLENFQSFIEFHFYWLYEIPLIFEPSHHKDELSPTEILTQGFGMKEWSFLPKDLTSDFQRFSDQNLLSITTMNRSLEEATEEDLRRSGARSELMPLLFEVFEIMGYSPRFLRSLRRDLTDPPFQAVSLVFLLHLENYGYGPHMDNLLEVCRLQVPRFRAFQILCLTLQKELPEVASELSTPQKLWKRVKDLSEPEREQYLTRKNEHLHEIYLQYQTEIDAFWLRHPEIKDALENESPSALSNHV
jgi:hypothetical protein